MDKEQARKKYLENIYWMEYNIRVVELMAILQELQHLIIIDDLDIDVDYYRKALSMIRKEIQEKSDSVTIDYYKGYIDKIELLINKINDEYSPLTIVDLYFKKIYQLTIDKEVELSEIEEIIEGLANYVEDLRISKEDEYQKVCTKYGVIKDKALIELIALSEEYNIKNRK